MNNEQTYPYSRYHKEQTGPPRDNRIYYSKISDPAEFPDDVKIIDVKFPWLARLIVKVARFFSR